MPDYRDDMRQDVERAYDKNDPERLPMVTCEHCGKKTPATNVAPGTIGGGTAAAAAGGGGG